MKYEDACQLSPSDFKRRFGVQRKTFELMLDVLNSAQSSQPKPGRKPKLTCGEKLLITLEYWREYRPYFHIASEVDPNCQARNVGSKALKIRNPSRD
jgi:hypothetical protein